MMLTLRFVDPRVSTACSRTRRWRSSWSTRARREAADKGAGHRAGQPGRRRRRRRGRATSPLPAAADARGGRRVEDRAAASSSCRSSSSCWPRCGAKLALLPPPDPRATPAARSASRRAPPPAARSCWPRSRSASTRRTRGPRSATSARPRARSPTRSTTTRCKRRIEDHAARATSPSIGPKLYGELTMNITIDAEGRVGRDRDRAPSKSRCSTAGGGDRACRAPFGPFTSAMRAKADQIVVTSRFRFTRDEASEPRSARSPDERRPYQATPPRPLRRARQPRRAQPLAVHPRRVRAPDRPGLVTSGRMLRSRSTTSRRRCAASRRGEGGAAATSRCRSSSRPFHCLAARRSTRTPRRTPNVLRMDDGRLAADNTDGVGLVRDIERHAGFDRAARAAVGRAVRGAAGVLPPLLLGRRRGVVVANRTPKAQALVQRHAARWPAAAHRSSPPCAAD